VIPKSTNLEKEENEEKLSSDPTFIFFKADKKYINTISQISFLLKEEEVMLKSALRMTNL
jgi:hypothetical protein